MLGGLVREHDEKSVNGHQSYFGVKMKIQQLLLLLLLVEEDETQPKNWLLWLVPLSSSSAPVEEE